MIIKENNGNNNSSSGNNNALAMIVIIIMMPMRTMIIVHHNNNYSNNNTINEQCTRVMTIMPDLFQRERERERARVSIKKRDVSTLTYQNHPKPGKSHGFSTKKRFFILNGWIYRKYGFPKTRGVIIQWTMTGQEGTIRMISF